VYSPKDLTAVLARAHGAGFQLAVHAIGDRAIDVVVEAIARVLDEAPREDHRHRIEHFELPSGDVLDRVQELGIVPSMQPNFVDRWSRPGGLYERRLGRPRVATNNPFREIRKRRLPLAFGSDGMPYGPLGGLRGVREPPFPSQRLSPTDAIRCYTSEGARASFEEGSKGTLAAGMLGDFVILSGDPRDSTDVQVRATVVGGRVVFRSRSRRRTI
jgi:hypothetical protein